MVGIYTDKVFDGPITRLINLIHIKCVYYVL